MNDLRKNVERFLEMASPEFDWEAHRENGDEPDRLDKVFRSCIEVGWPKEGAKYASCGSANVEDTPRALYRLLFLCKPKQVDFSDMYKNCLFGFFSTDRRFFVSVELFKYEVGLYF